MLAHHFCLELDIAQEGISSKAVACRSPKTTLRQICDNWRISYGRVGSPSTIQFLSSLWSLPAFLLLVTVLERECVVDGRADHQRSGENDTKDCCNIGLGHRGVSMEEHQCDKSTGLGKLLSHGCNDGI